MIKTVGKPFSRAMHFDFHTCPGIKNICKDFDAEVFAEKLSAAHVEYINFTARCNMGFSYYNTKVGKKYEGLADRDVLKETIDACHKRGIGVSAYINVGLNHEMAADHVDWLRIFSGGRIYKEDKRDNFFREMCYNSPYREHLFAEIRELCEYDIDGLFFDCLTARRCFCERCVADMKRKGFDPDNVAAQHEYKIKLRDDFCLDIRRVA